MVEMDDKGLKVKKDSQGSFFKVMKVTRENQGP